MVRLRYRRLACAGVPRTDELRAPNKLANADPFGGSGRSTNALSTCSSSPCRRSTVAATSSPKARSRGRNSERSGCRGKSASTCSSVRRRTNTPATRLTARWRAARPPGGPSVRAGFPGRHAFEPRRPAPENRAIPTGPTARQTLRHPTVLARGNDRCLIAAAPVKPAGPSSAASFSSSAMRFRCWGGSRTGCPCPRRSAG